MAKVFSIDPSESYVCYGPRYFGCGSSEKFPLSGTLSYLRVNGYSGVLEWSQIYLDNINIQPSSLPYGPLIFPYEYHGIFNGSFFSGSNDDCYLWNESGTCYSFGNISSLTGTLNQKSINMEGRTALDFDYSYFFTIKAAVTISDSPLVDFSNDGNVDILWRYKPTGMVGVWYMNGAGGASGSAVLAPSVDISWEIAGVGDFSNDGNVDILWRYKPTGMVGVWYMSGAGGASGSAVLAPSVDTNWEIAGVGDFSNDGNVDILWRYKPTGMVGVWYMNGAGGASGSAVLAPSVDISWEIAGVGDFSNDGNVDILWRYKPTGMVGVWYMSGAGGASGSAVLAPSVDTNWEIAGVGDFSNDGNVDILWRYKPTGMVGVWYMSGAGVASGSAVLAPSVDTNWEIVGH